MSVDNAPAPDPILDPSEDRFVLFPIKYPDLFKAYQDHLALFWTVQEIDLTQDLPDWEGLNPNERHFIEHVLAFFAASDGIVNENLCFRFANEVQISEARQFYAMQIMIEAIHSEMYSTLIDTYVKDPARQTYLFSAINTIPCVQKKAQWALKWLGSDAPFAHRLIAFACVEGIHFSGSFCALFWLKQRGIMQGLTTSNEFISRDEGLHRDFAILLHSKLQQPTSPEIIRQIIEEAVEIEREFVTNSLPVSLLGMNATTMTRYIEFVADHLARSCGIPNIYGTENPFPWMDMMGLSGKTNFFERRVSEYAKALGDHTVSFDEEF